MALKVNFLNILRHWPFYTYFNSEILPSVYCLCSYFIKIIKKDPVLYTSLHTHPTYYIDPHSRWGTLTFVLKIIQFKLTSPKTQHSCIRWRQHLTPGPASNHGLQWCWGFLKFGKTIHLQYQVMLKIKVLIRGYPHQH